MLKLASYAIVILSVFSSPILDRIEFLKTRALAHVAHVRQIALTWSFTALTSLSTDLSALHATSVSHTSRTGREDSARHPLVGGEQTDERTCEKSRVVTNRRIVTDVGLFYTRKIM